MRFSDWLLSQLAKENWTQTRLSKESGLSKQAITNYVNGRTPDKYAIEQIAGAFRLKPEEVYRVAMGKPANPDADPWVDEMSHKLSLLSPGLRTVAERFINSMLEGETAEKQKAKPKPRQRSSIP